MTESTNGEPDLRAAVRTIRPRREALGLSWDWFAELCGWDPFYSAMQDEPRYDRGEWGDTAHARLMLELLDRLEAGEEAWAPCRAPRELDFLVVPPNNGGKVRQAGYGTAGKFCYRLTRDIADRSETWSRRWRTADDTRINLFNRPR